MKLLIVCVNYNSYTELHQYLLSVNEAAARVRGDTQVDVIVADNSTEKQDFATGVYDRIGVRIIVLENKGYLGSAQTVINTTEDILQYDYVAISNVDLLFDSTTLLRLQESKIDEEVAWMAPSIISDRYNRDLNPSVLCRYKPWKLKVLKLTYYRWTYWLYERFVYARKKARVHHPRRRIYAGHGSFILLTANFFKCYDRIDYPVFLYGEELYFAELIRRKYLKVIYSPTVVIYTSGGVSTSKLPSKSFLRYNREAIDYILRTFYA